MEALQVSGCGEVLGCPGLRRVALALEQGCVGAWLAVAEQKSGAGPPWARGPP